MNVTSSSQSSRRVATAVEHPRLTKTDAVSVRLLLRTYKQYARELNVRARQLVGEDVITTEATKSLQIKYCVNAEWLESLINLDFIFNVCSYDAINESQLEQYLTKNAEESKDLVNINSLAK